LSSFMQKKNHQHGNSFFPIVTANWLLPQYSDI
jgi:hypothetical protein